MSNIDKIVADLNNINVDDLNEQGLRELGTEL